MNDKGLAILVDPFLFIIDYAINLAPSPILTGINSG